jgi:dephospho-CoA kinase
MIILGLTGSIGMGKSTTAQMFRDAGVPVFDADAAVHALYRGAAVAPVEAAFPGVTRDGAIDRVLLAARVLADPEALHRLESIVHPLVAAERRTFLDTARRDGAPVVVLDIPLLFETGGEAAVDAVAVVSAPESVQKARVLSRPGMTPERFSAILAKQVPDTEKRRRADFVIETGEGMDAARARAADILAALRGRSEPRGEKAIDA